MIDRAEFPVQMNNTLKTLGSTSSAMTASASHPHSRSAMTEL